jgi:hypothetical protein
VKTVAQPLPDEKSPRQRTTLALAIVAVSLTLALVALTVAVTLALASSASVAAILANPDRFDRQPVTINGAITHLRETVSGRGNTYYTFDLSDGTQAIRVFSFGTAPCRSGAATV